MEDSKLITVLQKLDKKEQKALKKWLDSPAFNQRLDVQGLYNYLLRVLFSFSRGKTTDQEIFQAIYPGEMFSKKKLNHVFSYLFTAVKSFLTWQEFQHDGEQKNIYLCRALRKKGLHKAFESAWKDTLKQLERQPFRNAGYHWQKSQLHREWFEYSASLSRTGIDSLQEYFNELNYFFAGLKLEQACAGLTYENLQNVQFEYALLPHVLNFADEVNREEVPAINLYFNTYQAFSDSAEKGNEHFEEMLRVLQDYGYCFPKNELRNAYLLAINYCIKRVNNNQPDFLPIIFDLFKEGLGKGVFTENGLISRFTYTNIVKTAIANQQFAWAEDFIKDYQGQLGAKYQESIFLYNQLLLCYRQAQYERAIDLYAGLQLDDLLYNLDAKRILIKIYYERNEWNALHSLLDSFYAYLYRHKGLKYHKSSYLNLIRFIRKMMQLAPYERDKKEDLTRAIAKTEALVEKKWLLEQLKD